MPCMTYQKSNSNWAPGGYFFWADRAEIDEKTRKIGNSYFLYDFPFTVKANHCSVYSMIPHRTYQNSKSIGDAKNNVLGINYGN